MTEINIKEFTCTVDKFQGTDTHFRHKISTGTLKSYPGRQWYCKEINDPALARLEILAQETFRLINPYQPRTLLAKNYTNNTYFILSEEVPGFHKLPRNEAKNFRNGHYQGLGRALPVAMYIEETDLKIGNIGLDDKGQVIKIDGDWCFSENRYSGKFTLTSEGIAALPRPVGYPAWHWLDFIVAGNPSSAPSSSYFDEQLSKSKQFRAEVNESIYRICLLPDCVIEALVDSHMPAGGQRFIDLLKERRNELQKSAIHDPSFAAYLQNPESRKHAYDFLHELKKFEANDQFLVANLKTLEREFIKNFNFPIELNTPMLDECSDLLSDLDNLGMLEDPFMDEAVASYRNILLQCAKDPKQVSEILQMLHKLCKNIANAREIIENIAQYKLNSNDKLMDAEIRNLNEEVSKNAGDPKKIMQMESKLTALLDSVSSKEIVAVEKTINKMRSNAGFFSVGLDKKADKIAHALLNTPIAERGTILSSVKTTAVQEALATHRYLGSRGDVYKTKDGKIDAKRAPTLFNKLKAEHSSPQPDGSKVLIEKGPTNLII